MFLLAAFAALSIGVSFICSLLEAALLSMTPSYVAGLRETRPELHRRLAHLKQNIDQPLAAILTLNTIAHTVGPPAWAPRSRWCSARPGSASPRR